MTSRRAPFTRTDIGYMAIAAVGGALALLLKAKSGLDARAFDSGMLNNIDMRVAQEFTFIGYCLTALLMLLSGWAWAKIQRQAAGLRQQIEQLKRDLAAKDAEASRLAMAREAENAQGQKQRREAMQEIAENFEFSVKGAVSQVANSASQMQAGAESVTRIAADTKERSVLVVAASDEAAHATAQVAAAAEELTASIKEISSQTQRSSKVAGEAAAKAAFAKEAIDQLSEKSLRVGEIIELITGIAGQINLLALNATIESARAGEAGKGFAVVASEVKNLASQVGKATDEITQQIGEMQGATKNSVDSVMDILGIIGQVSASTTAVAAAIEQQSAVTNEIASNVARTSTGAQQISHNIAGVQEGAEQTGVTAQNVLETAKNLGGQSILLKQKVEEFLQTIRAA